MIQVEAYRLERAVAAICPDIELKVSERVLNLSEDQLWWELSCCLLSSQVSYNLAVAAADALAENEIFTTRYAQDPTLEEIIETTLRKKVIVNGKKHIYRFSSSRARQLAQTKHAVLNEADSLKSLLTSFEHPVIARNWLVKNAPGFGPKQASMFLRNSGKSYDLAIIDRHVLNYMNILGIIKYDGTSVPTLNKYNLFETDLRLHAENLGVAVGLLDWAIWIVMRAARNSNLTEH